MPTARLKEFLDSHNVKYVTLEHSKAFTAAEIAALAHVPGREMAKTVMVDVDGHMAMAVLPASLRVSFDQLRAAIGAQTVVLSNERDFVERFPGCEVGAMPPFGNLYGMEVYVADSLARQDEIAFNAGTHTEVIRMAWADYERLVQPLVMDFAVARPL
ncbi:MAG TPA: YbaK/EbsC family protein [Gemmatimonadales bacterium]|nr:YbaK/EbsC family protein [Gemmatimonadales bacterium]